MTPPQSLTPAEVQCVRCLQLTERRDLDRLLWCDPCKEAARSRAGLWGWVVGLAGAVALSVWIWLVVQPTLLIGAWAGTVVAALWLGAKVAREVIYGLVRLHNVPAVEAVPPTSPPSDDERRVRFR